MVNLNDFKESRQLFDNRYELIDRIGSGGFSEVWLARDTTADLDVALKVYMTEGRLNNTSKNLFRQEFRDICALQHTNIIHAVGFGIYNDEAPYLCMTVCKDGSANKLKGRISEEDLWDLIKQVASGLEYLHGRDIVHQDIKPDNILINNGQYLIIDFGISAKSRSTLRQTENGNNGGGTTWYMSAESFDNTNPSSLARDIWAFGATLFELMTGDVPFGQYGGLTQLKKNGAIPEISNNYSDDLKQLTYKCLSLYPWDRPSAEQILEIVNSHSKGEKLEWGKEDNGGKSIIKKFSVSLVASVAVLSLLYVSYLRHDVSPQEITSYKNDSLYLAEVEKVRNAVNEHSTNIMKQPEADKISVAPIIKEIQHYTEFASKEDSITIDAKYKAKECKDSIRNKVNQVCQFLETRGNQKLEYGPIGHEPAQKYFARRDSIKKYINSIN